MTTVQINSVTFDAGNTLLYCDPSPAEIYATSLSRFGRTVTADAVEPVFSHAWAEMQRRTSPGVDRYSSQPGGERAWWAAFLREVLRLLEHDASPDALLDDLYAAFSRPDVWKTYPEALKVLDRLRAMGYSTAIVSNWDHRLPKILDDLQITLRVDAVLVSSIEGVEKPARQIFDRALERLGTRASETLHIGDSPREDYFGAQSAGLEAALIDRKAEFANDQMTTITSLEDVFDLLGGVSLIDRADAG
ncbi:MAG: HAD-IA family hydrolase [bacterium]|nr:HAD-IA family hydrolase [bacterium]